MDEKGQKGNPKNPVPYGAGVHAKPLTRCREYGIKKIKKATKYALLEPVGTRTTKKHGEIDGWGWKTDGGRIWWNASLCCMGHKNYFIFWLCIDKPEKNTIIYNNIQSTTEYIYVQYNS